MRDDEKNTFSETAANIVENIAYRVAERQGGRITVNHLAPYLPISLGLLKSCMDNMVDDHSVLAGEMDPFPTFEFTACLDKPCEKGPLHFDTCLSCDTDLSTQNEHPLCSVCFQALEKELNRLAETMGWPAKAVYEHEILYLAALNQGPHYAAQLAGHSRYTLKRMKQKLKAMTLEHYVCQELDEKAATIVYQFPEITYPKESYQRNMAVIRRYPASVTEDMEIKATRITLSLAVLLLIFFILAFLRIPLPVLIIGFVIISPLVALKIWRHKDQPPEE